jgi:hypothetical protein
MLLFKSVVWRYSVGLDEYPIFVAAVVARPKHSILSSDAEFFDG